jgi:methylmalonyl-CoA/ethylmalonyl-CoA epimerase
MIKGLDHLGIAVSDLDESIASWEAVAKAHVVHREIVQDQGVEVVMLRVGTMRIELICPLRDDATVARFLSKRGEGLHHISLECDSIEDELGRLRTAGVELVDDHPRKGAENALVAFVHPRSLSGVLLEFVDHNHDNVDMR